jgi:hypothetical protein
MRASPTLQNRITGQQRVKFRSEGSGRHEQLEIETGKGADAIERRPQLAAALAEARRHGNAPSWFPSSIASAETSISFPA